MSLEGGAFQVFLFCFQYKFKATVCEAPGVSISQTHLEQCGDAKHQCHNYIIIITMLVVQHKNITVWFY